ncbi:MAG: hypothetical protein ACI9XU_000085 [Arenicella sp.]|jgi:hypothetical protein
MIKLRLINSPTCQFKQKTLILLALVFITACATRPAYKFDQYALSAGLVKSVIETNNFSLTSYSRSNLLEIKSTPVLNIYLSGDGRPWITQNYKSVDPTPRKHMALDLLLLDQNSSIYVGRPCYHAISIEPVCNSKWWTSHRYSKQVITALLEAVNSLTNPSQRLNLIGFSGGGSLAMLLAPKLINPDGSSRVNAVVTISANLDTQHWAQAHNYSPLTGSLNPIQQTLLDSNIKQYHLFGKLDQNVDAAYLANKLEGRPSTTVRVFPNFGHHCCWPEIWPQFINSLK